MINCVVVLCMSLFVVGCAQSDAQPASLRDAMPWQTDLPWWATDLNPRTTGTQIVHWVLAFEQECESTVNLGGGNVLTVSGSTEVSPPHTTDAPCAMFDGTWTYQLQGSELTLCQQGLPPQDQTCEVFNAR